MAQKAGQIPSWVSAGLEPNFRLASIRIREEGGQAISPSCFGRVSIREDVHRDEEDTRGVIRKEGGLEEVMAMLEGEEVKDWISLVPHRAGPPG